MDGGAADSLLQTLFEKYNLSKVTLHYNFQGRSLGTAELQGPRQVISRIERDFAGVEIDGEHGFG